MLGQQQQTNNKQPPEAKAFHTEKNKKQHSNTKGNFQQKKNENKCEKCGMNNHSTNDCRAPQWKIERHSHFKNNSQQNNNSSNNKTEQKSNSKAYHIHMEDYSESLQIKGGKDQSINRETNGSEFILDSGCTHHMINKNILFNIEETKFKVAGPLGKAKIESA